MSFIYGQNSDFVHFSVSTIIMAENGVRENKNKQETRETPFSCIISIDVA